MALDPDQQTNVINEIVSIHDSLNTDFDANVATARDRLLTVCDTLGAHVGGTSEGEPEAQQNPDTIPPGGG